MTALAAPRMKDAVQGSACAALRACFQHGPGSAVVPLTRRDFDMVDLVFRRA